MFKSWLTRAAAYLRWGCGNIAYAHQHNGTALRMWLPLAEKGYPGAQNNLGVLYQHGQGIPQDSAEAVKWYRLAAAQGHTLAQYNLGYMYKYSVGVPYDKTEADRWDRLTNKHWDIVARGMCGRWTQLDKLAKKAQESKTFLMSNGRAPPPRVIIPSRLGKPTSPR